MTKRKSKTEIREVIIANKAQKMFNSSLMECMIFLCGHRSAASYHKGASLCRIPKVHSLLHFEIKQRKINSMAKLPNRELKSPHKSV